MGDDREADGHKQQQNRDIEKKCEAVWLSALPFSILDKPDAGVDRKTEQ